MNCSAATCNATTSEDNFSVKPNSTTYSLSEYPVWYWTLRGIISFVTVVGNGLAIYLICSRKQLRKKESPNWLILSLAVADFLVGLFNVPSSIVCRYWFSCSYITYQSVNSLMDVVMIASVTNLCVLTLDRYVAVVHPFTYLFMCTKSRVRLLIILAWVISFIKGIPYLVFKLTRYKDGLFVDSIIYMIIFTVVPNLLTVYAYTRILLVLRRHKVKIKEHEMQIAVNMETNPKGQKSQNSKAHNGAVAAVGILNIIFLSCNGFFQYYLTCKLIKGCVVSTNLRYATFLLRYFNSAPNFFVYALARKTFRDEIKHMFF